MNHWELLVVQARQNLKRHNPHKALHLLACALKLCPAENCSCNARILFYLGIALKRTGHLASALHLWISAYHFRKNKFLLKIINRYANGYGMLKQATPELDDKFAFFSLQINRYLGRKQKSYFATAAERDVVLELISDYWKMILAKGLLQGKTIAEKRELFSKVTIPFPYFYLPKSLNDSILRVNFLNERLAGESNRCFCGSGLPFAMCCGRHKPLDRLLFGNF